MFIVLLENKSINFKLEFLKFISTSIFDFFFFVFFFFFYFIFLSNLFQMMKKYMKICFKIDILNISRFIFNCPLQSPPRHVLMTPLSLR